MLFRRRNNPGLWHKARQYVWPSMGWTRTYHYFRHRIFRNTLGTHEIAGGMAVGMAVSFTPLIGTHLLQALLFAWLFRLNVLAAFAATVIGNPWTFPFIFWLDYRVGAWVFGLFGMEGAAALMMLVGGVLCALLVWPLAYMVLYYPVKGAQRAYRLQKILRRRKGKKAS